MIILNVEQGSQAWFDARIGLISASNFGKIISPTGKKSTQYKTYMNGLIAEVMMNKKTETHTSEAMARGTELEPEARAYYELVTGNTAKEVGLVYMNDEKRVSCSPDGLMESKGLEIKCPLPSTQIKYLLSGEIPNEYIPQVQGSMMVTGLKEWDFLAYHPELNQLMITVKADQEYQDKMREYIDGFIIEMKESINKLMGL